MSVSENALVPEFYEVRLFTDDENPGGYPGYQDHTRLRVCLKERANGHLPHVEVILGGELARTLNSTYSLEVQTRSLAALFRAYADRLDEMAPNLIAGEWK